MSAHLQSTNFETVATGNGAVRFLWQFILNKSDALESMIAVGGLALYIDSHTHMLFPLTACRPGVCL